ncbi:MAG: ABC transporter permease subunit [Clostridia bacterium]
MSKLIKNELIKIFSKKSMIVIGVIILVIIIGFNVLNKVSQNMSNSYSAYSEGYIQYLDEELANLDPNKPSDINKYVETKSQKDLATLAKDYKETSWQAEVIGTVISPIIEEMNNYEYIDKNNEALTTSKAQYDEMLTALKNNDWKYFANKELESINTQIEELNALISQDSENDDLKIQLKSLELQKEVVNLRLDKNINYGSDNYKSIAVQNYRMYMGNYIQSSQGKNLTDDEKSEINGYLENANLYKYDLYNDTEYQNTATANYTFQNSIGTYIAIIVMVVVIVAGVSISEEFNKGTVKLLLVRPYSRTKILISKLIAVFITMLITTVAILLLQFIIGGIVYGFGTYMMNVVQFDFTTNSIITLNIFAYLGLIFICKLPIFILIGTLAFALSTLFLNSPLAVALPILGYMGSDMINMIAISYKWDWVKYFVTPNWDLSQYLFGGTPMFSGTSIEFSITICVIYFAIMLVASIVSFKKRNIKNV